MESLVLELQRDILDQNVSATTILRKAFAIARKLNIPDIEEWLDSELNGYKDNDKIPEYRSLNGQLKAWNPYHGWQPLFMEDAEIAEKLSNKKSNQTIPELEKMLSNDNGKGSFYMPFSKEKETILMRGMNIPLQPALLTSASQIQGIIECVRNAVLDWALQLESKSILGENMKFSTREKSTARNITININKNYITNMRDSQIQQGATALTQTYVKDDLNIDKVKALVSEIKRNMTDLSLPKSDQERLASEIKTVEEQLKLPDPKKNILKESFTKVKKIFSGIATAKALVEKIAEIFF